MYALAAIAVTVALELNHPGVIIHLAQQQSLRESDIALRVAKRYVRDQRREYDQQRTRYLRAIRSRNQRATRLARQAMGRAQAHMAVGAESHRRFDYYYPGIHRHR
jgi:hypothetical protein